MTRSSSGSSKAGLSAEDDGQQPLFTLFRASRTFFFEVAPPSMVELEASVAFEIIFQSYNRKVLFNPAKTTSANESRIVGYGISIFVAAHPVIFLTMHPHIQTIIITTLSHQTRL